MLVLLINDARHPAIHQRELGGTQVAYNGLLNGEIDVYPEYTGTLIKEVFSDRKIGSEEQLRAALRAQGVSMSKPLGFNNTYAIGMLRKKAESLGIEKISDLNRFPDLRLGFSHEFMIREDGWRNLKPRYELQHADVKGLDHDLAYRQLELGVIDAVDVYSTDAKIAAMDLRVLEDDLEYFPPYDAVLLYRNDFAERYPKVAESVLRLEGRFNEDIMRKLNGRPEQEDITETKTAADFLAEALGIVTKTREPNLAGRVAKTTLQHLDLVRRSLIPAILVAIPLGILAAKWPTAGHVILASVGFVQTIPSLALLVMLMPLMARLEFSSIGTGSTTAVVALFLYSLLPIVRNTHAGISGIASGHLESAQALGLPPWYRLLHIELPLAARSILAGIQTAAVINVGFATLGALIGAGGYGQPILSGIRLAKTPLILEGALPAAALALLVQGAFELAERTVLPRGLRVN
jgi:osmoprotectant transport system permease protein